MAIEHARTRVLPKPWGVEDLLPWSYVGHDGNAIGEIWYERPDSAALDPSLLLKLLFTSQPLSVQVHPDDAFAHAMGLPRGKTEAWYVLSAAPEAKVALGLSRRLTAQQLREAIGDGSISSLLVWHTVSANDVLFVPAGTIHAIGAGLVIAELQQRSDTTFRLFDHGRERELHIEDAIMVADAGTADFQVRQSQLTAERRLLVSNLHFGFERIDLTAKLLLVSASGTRDLASRYRRQRYRWIVRVCHRRYPVRAIGPCRHSPQRRRYGGPRGVHGRRRGPAATATSHTTRRNRCRTAKGDTGANFSHPSKGCTEEWPPGNN